MVAGVVATLLVATGCAGDPGAQDAEVRTVIAPGRTAEPPPEEVERNDIAGAETCDDAYLAPDEDNRRAIERATLCLVNAERTKRDREPLRDHDELTTAARRKARHMVGNDYFAHVGPDGRDVRDWVGRTSYLDGARGYRLGENLGWGSEGAANPARLVVEWMDSPSHRRNILVEGYRDSGVGVVLGAPQERGGGATYVQVFGRR